MTMDPVCEMKVDERKSSYVTSFEGATYHFCSRECQNEFNIDPRRYVGRPQELAFQPPEYDPSGVPPEKRQQDRGPLR